MSGVRRFTFKDVVILIVVGAALLLFPPLATRQPWHESFLTYLVAIVLQATPYLLLGAALGAAIETFIPAHWLPTLARRLGPWGIPVMVLCAPLFPICECAVLGVGRSLLRRGLPLPHAITYLIAAPIINPTVLIATGIAFGDPFPAFLRAIGGASIALVIGCWVARLRPERCLVPQPVLSGMREITAAGPATPLAAASPVSCAHDDGPAWTRWIGVRWCRTSLDHFLELAGWFLAGVAIAAALKALVGTRILEQLGDGVVSGPAMMMTSAVILSLCAEADAFVAVSFTGFTLPALMSFLVLGPMLDIKLMLMYRSIFRDRFILTLAAVMVILVSLYTAALTVWL